MLIKNCKDRSLFFENFD